jgi:hypothetical protein
MVGSLAAQMAASLVGTRAAWLACYLVDR